MTDEPMTEAVSAAAVLAAFSSALARAVASAFGASLGMLSLYHALGFCALAPAAAAPALLLISVASAAVELLPIGDDNLTVPLAAAALAAALLRPA